MQLGLRVFKISCCCLIRTHSAGRVPQQELASTREKKDREETGRLVSSALNISFPTSTVLSTTYISIQRAESPSGSWRRRAGRVRKEERRREEVSTLCILGGKNWFSKELGVTKLEPSHRGLYWSGAPVQTSFWSFPRCPLESCETTESI